MKVKKFIALIILLICVGSFFLYGAGVAMEETQTAITNSGRKVILYQSQRWEYEKLSQENQIYDFKKVIWGMLKEQVKESETEETPTDGDYYLAYVVEVANMDAYLYYVFANKQLVRTKYYFTEEHTNEKLFIDDYNKLVDILTTKYGIPEYDQGYWSDDLYKKDKEDWGKAVKYGDVYFQAFWETDTTKILCHLSGDNYEIELAIHYKSKKLEYLEDQEEEKENLEVF
jgi:hypothetical protein